eukprot:2852276-Alexandrium_andersonii.AAC.1
MVRHRVARPVSGLRPELGVPDLLCVALGLQHLHGPRPFGADDSLRQGPEVTVRDLAPRPSAAGAQAPSSQVAEA